MYKHTNYVKVLTHFRIKCFFANGDVQPKEENPEKQIGFFIGAYFNA